MQKCTQQKIAFLRIQIRPDPNLHLESELIIRFRNRPILCTEYKKMFTSEKLVFHWSQLLVQLYRFFSNKGKKWCHVFFIQAGSGSELKKVAHLDNIGNKTRIMPENETLQPPPLPPRGSERKPCLDFASNFYSLHLCL